MFVEHLEDSLVMVYIFAKTAPALGGIVMKTWRWFVYWQRNAGNRGQKDRLDPAEMLFVTLRMQTISRQEMMRMLKGIQDVEWWDRCMHLKKGVFGYWNEELPGDI